jgi:ATP-dependent DNA ligase
MLAKAVRQLPRGDMLYEPKWDGFRALVFRDGDELFVQSRDLRPLLRYFPELEGPLKAALPDRCVVDGEIVVPVGDRLSFEALQLRLHPAASRVTKLAAETPAAMVLFDVLAVGDEDLRCHPFAARRARLEAVVTPGPAVRVTPASRDPEVAARWLRDFGGEGLDGVVAKPLDGPYEAGRRALFKVKQDRTVDCVVAGFRWATDAPGKVGSLVLGLFDDAGRLQQVGVAASFGRARRDEVTAAVLPLREGALDGHPWADEARPDDRRPGGGSRWARDRSLAWEPVRLELVAEVSANQVTAGRFRHPAKLVRLRTDKPVADCRVDQLEVVPPAELAALLAGTGASGPRRASAPAKGRRRGPAARPKGGGGRGRPRG